MLEEPLFGFQTASVAGQLSARSNYAVTRDNDGDRIEAVGPSDGAGGLWLPETGGQFSVSFGRTEGDLGESCPDLFLKVGAYRVQGGLEVLALAFEVLLKLGGYRLDNRMLRARCSRPLWHVLVFFKVDARDAALGGQKA